MRIFLQTISLLLILLGFSIGVSLFFFSNQQSLGVNWEVPILLFCGGFILLGISALLDGLEVLVEYAEQWSAEESVSNRSEKEPLSDFMRRLSNGEGAHSSEGISHAPPQASGGERRGSPQRKEESSKKEISSGHRSSLSLPHNVQERFQHEPDQGFGALKGAGAGSSKSSSFSKTSYSAQENLSAFDTKRKNISPPLSRPSEGEGLLASSYGTFEEGGKRKEKKEGYGGVEHIEREGTSVKLSSSEEDWKQREEEETQLFVMEEKWIAGKMVRVLSDGTVEAQVKAGWMRFEDLDHLREYMEATGEHIPHGS